MSSCIALIFSKDRALQLDATLRSFLLHCKDIGSIQIRILYTTADAVHTKQYEELAEEYKKYTFIQFIREQDFRSDTLALIAPFDCVLFLVDDNIFIKNFSLSEVVQSLKSHPDSLGFSLSLGENTWYCYTLNKNQRLPEFDIVGNNVLKHNWTKGECDFGYPLEVSSSVYRTEDILPFISRLSFVNPNTLESLMANHMAAFQAEKPFLLCFDQSVAFCTPINIVQKAWINRAGRKIEYSPDNLAKLFGQGYRIDVQQFTNFVPNSRHQEVEMPFINSRGTSPTQESTKNPLISIIILNYNGLEDIRTCLESIKRNTGEDHEIIIVDNASTDGSLDYLRPLPDIILVENPVNIGCPPARAQAMTLAKGDYIIFLDNDTVVTKGWATRFIRHAKTDPSIGIMGPRSNYVSGPQIVPNVTYRDINELEKFASTLSQQHHGQLTPTIRLVGFCMFVRREVVDKIGSIDASFGKFGFEDDDYTSRTLIAGFKAFIANDVFIHHTGGPQGRGDSQYNKSVWDAWEVFKHKWNLPDNLSYGYNSPDISTKILSQPFDPQKHYIPLPERSEVEKLIRPGRTQKSEAPSAGSSEKPSSQSAEEEKPSVLKIYRIKELVSIVILLSNRQECTGRCIERIKKYTSVPHEIIFVHGDTSENPAKWLRNIVKGNPNYKLVKPPPYKGGHSPTLGFSEACNLGIKESSGEYIVLLDDAVVVTEGWLPDMLKCLNSSVDTGIVGPITVNIEGRQQYPGSDYSPDHLDVFARSFREKNRYRRIEVRSVDSFCMLFRHDLTRRIGLFDERVEIDNYAGKDYCFRAAMEGCKNLIAGDVFIDFHGHRSPKAGLGSPSPLNKDRRILIEKWGNPNDTSQPESKKKFVMDTLFLADELSQKGEKGNAVLALQEAIKTDTEDQRLYIAVAEILIGESKFREALETLGRMPEWMKKEFTTLELTGLCKEGMRQSSEAEKYADEVLRYTVSSPRAWNLKGTVAFTRILYPDAERFFRRVIDVDPGYGEAYANIGSLRWQQGKKEEAFGLFEKAFILTPIVEDVITNYYAAANYLSKLPEVENVFREAIALYPSNRRLQFVLIDNLLQQNRFEEAMKEIEEAMITFGIDDDTLNVALKLRERVGEKTIAGSKVQRFKGSREKESAIHSTSGTMEPCNHATIEPCDYATLSLCMIVKNEETKIMHALRSVAPVADEMIVVDTGSTDRTKKIATAFEAKVYDFSWADDFSEARNFSLSKASGNWIFILDADEVISPSDYKKLKELVIKGSKVQGFEGSTENSSFILHPSSFCAYSFVTRNYVGTVSMNWQTNDGQYKEEAGAGWFPSSKVRLFPKDPQIRFENPVHEWVEDSLLRIGMEIRKADIPIHHYGKLNKEEVLAKGERYYQLGKIKILEQRELNPGALHELAVQASELEKFDEALEYWKKLTAVQPFLAKAHYGLGTSFFHLSRYEEALSALGQAIQINPDSKDYGLMHATCEIYAGSVDTAVTELENILKKEPDYSLALHTLAAAYLCSGRKEKGIEYFKVAQNTEFNIIPYITGMAKNLISVKRPDYACRLLEALEETGNATDETSRLLDECRESQKGSRVQGFEDASEKYTDKEGPSDSILSTPRTLEPSTPASPPRTLSLCMIVKNEEENIKRSLMSVKHAVDEMIVVDTGSSDRTKEIAERLGARVFEFPWTGNFSDARNFSISKASREWILILDADESISFFDHDKLKELIVAGARGQGFKDSRENSSFILHPSSLPAYSFLTRNYVMETNTAGWIANDGKYFLEETGTGWYPGEKVRLFPRDSRIFFEFPVHERIEPSLVKAGIGIRKSGIPVHHYGKLNREKARSKAESYYLLGKKKLAESGENDAMTLYELAIQGAEIGRYEETIEYLKKVAALKPDFPKTSQSMGNAFYNLGKYEEALPFYKKALAFDPGARDTILMCATTELLAGSADNAISLLQKLLEDDPSYSQALLVIAEAYFCAGRTKEGSNYIKKLQALHFDCGNLFNAFAKMLISAGRHDYAVSLLESAVEAGIATDETRGLLEGMRER